MHMERVMGISCGPPSLHSLNLRASIRATTKNGAGRNALPLPSRHSKQASLSLRWPVQVAYAIVLSSSLVSCTPSRKHLSPTSPTVSSHRIIMDIGAGKCTHSIAHWTPLQKRKTKSGLVPRNVSCLSCVTSYVLSTDTLHSSVDTYQLCVSAISCFVLIWLFQFNCRTVTQVAHLTRVFILSPLLFTRRVIIVLTWCLILLLCL